MFFLFVYYYYFKEKERQKDLQKWKIMASGILILANPLGVYFITITYPLGVYFANCLFHIKD